MDAGSELARLQTLAIAALLAGLIGFEREAARRPAGLRTHILVGVAAALLMDLATLMTTHLADRVDPGMISLDPVRILQAIIVGVSFLGAGTIIQGSDARVEGLTTAASLLLTAAIGVAVALDQLVLATVLAVSVTFLLFVVGKLEDSIGTQAPAPQSSDPAEPEAPIASGTPLPRGRSGRMRAPAGSD
jgi:putative Mg2+ transporter-C (MgtC) family protein